jgi:hypothetical protein
MATHITDEQRDEAIMLISAQVMELFVWRFRFGGDDEKVEERIKFIIERDMPKLLQILTPESTLKDCRA